LWVQVQRGEAVEEEEEDGGGLRRVKGKEGRMKKDKRVCSQEIIKS
jgi:hypothetical protein